MKLTYFGHSCFSVETAGKTLLFDPFITPNELAKDISLDDIKADYILISHGHFDHIHDAVELLKKTGATCISNFEIITWLAKKGIEDGHPMNHGGGFQFDFGLVKYVNAVHSSQLPDGSYGGNAGGFVIENDEGAFYYAGDTALTLDMELIGQRFDLDFVVLPIGDNFTMGPEDALVAADMLDCSEVVGVHYDTFPLIKIDKDAAVSFFLDDEVKLHLPAIGASVSF